MEHAHIQKMAVGWLLCIMLSLSCTITPVCAKDGQSYSSAKIEELQKRLDRIVSLEDVNVFLEERTDPFNPFFVNTFTQDYSVSKKPVAKKKKFQPPAHCATALECMDVGQLTLVAIIMKQNGGAVAMVQDASGLGYVLKPGMKIGYRNGVVENIMMDRVVVTEEYEDFNGEIANRNRILFLHPEDE